MFILDYDIDNLLISYILNGTEKENFNMINRLYIIFGRSQFKNFIMNVKKFYFDLLFMIYEVKTIENFLIKLLKNDNLQFDIQYIKFVRHSYLKYINFRSLDKVDIILICYLSLYNDYILICSKNYKCKDLNNKNICYDINCVKILL